MEIWCWAGSVKRVLYFGSWGSRLAGLPVSQGAKAFVGVSRGAKPPKAEADLHNLTFNIGPIGHDAQLTLGNFF